MSFGSEIRGKSDHFVKIGYYSEIQTPVCNECKYGVFMTTSQHGGNSGYYNDCTVIKDHLQETIMWFPHIIIV